MSAYIKFDGVDGECQEKDHKGWTEISSFNFGATKPTVGGATDSARRHGDVHLHDFTISQRFDKASVKIMEAGNHGKVYKDVKIDVTMSYGDATKGRTKYLEYKLEHVLIVNYQFSAGHDGVPEVHYALNFEKIEITYHESDEKGGSKGKHGLKFDLMQHK
jgi:type VI secretion system secreted protein Hcp